MPLPRENRYTLEDIFNLPDGQRAELIDGQMYMMSPPSYKHQKLVMELSASIRDYIKTKGSPCEVLPAPFAVILNRDEDTHYVEPDISVICDKEKLSDRGCEGAPDMVIEIVSPSSRRMDYSIKNGIYAQSGVREYWIVDPAKERTTTYRYDEDDAPSISTFDQPLAVGILDGLQITIADLLK